LRRIRIACSGKAGCRSGHDGGDGRGALALVLFAIAREPATGLIACVFAGISWVAAISTLNVSAQFALPGWVRGRGMAMFATAQFAGLAVGSIVWGQAAEVIGLPAVHIIAAIALVVSVPLLRRWRLQTAAGLDLAPSMDWPARSFHTTSSPTEVRCWSPSNTP
jgi:MFS family permease